MKSAGILITGLVVVLSGCGSDSKQEARHDLQRAALALKQGSPQVAITHLNKSLAKEPSAEAYQLRAEARLDPEPIRRALADAEAALKLRPNSQKLREMRDRAAACLKLLEGEPQVVEVRYKGPSKIEPGRINVVGQTGLGDSAEQRKELRNLVVQNPFWKASTRVERESYIQDLLDLENEFIPLAVSCERHQLTVDESNARDHRDQVDLNLRVASGHLRSWGTISNLEIAKELVGRNILLTSQQRSAIVQDVMDQDIDVLAMERLASTPAFKFSIRPDEYRSPVEEHRWKRLSCEDQNARRLSNDPLLSRLRLACLEYPWWPNNHNADLVIPRFGGVVVHR